MFHNLSKILFEGILFEGILFSLFQVLQIGIVVVSLPFKPDVQVCLMSVLLMNPLYEPFHNIPDVKSKDKQLQHLSGVDRFVIQYAFV